MLQMLWLTLAGEQQAHTTPLATLVATGSHECATAPETHANVAGQSQQSAQQVVTAVVTAVVTGV